MAKAKKAEEPETVEEPTAEVVEEPAEEQAEDTPMTVDVAVEKIKGMWGSIQEEGFSSVASRGVAALEGFIGGLKGDKKPPKE